MRFSFFLFLFLLHDGSAAALSRLLLRLFQGFFSPLGAKEVVGVQTSLTSTESRRCAFAQGGRWGGGGVEMDFNNAFGRRVKNYFSLEAPRLSSHSAASEETFFLSRFNSRVFDWLPGTPSSFIPFVSDSNRRSVCAECHLFFLFFSLFFYLLFQISKVSPQIMLPFFQLCSSRCCIYNQ